MASASSGAKQLFGVEEILGVGSASRGVVDLTSNVTLPGQANCALSDGAEFTGTASQAGVFLTQLPLSPESRIVWIVKVTVAGHVRTYDSECLSTSLPKGKYLMQLVHTAGTSQVRLKLPGLPGRGGVRLSGPDRSAVASLPEVTPSATDPLTDPATASWGAHAQLRGQGSVLTLGVIAGGLSDRGVDTQGDCLVSGTENTLPDPVAFAPGCPLGGSGISYGSSGIENWQATLTSNLAPGRYGAGYWFVGTPTHSPWGATTFWLANLS